MDCVKTTWISIADYAIRLSQPSVPLGTGGFLLSGGVIGKHCKRGESQLKGILPNSYLHSLHYHRLSGRPRLLSDNHVGCKSPPRLPYFAKRRSINLALNQEATYKSTTHIVRLMANALMGLFQPKGYANATIPERYHPCCSPYVLCGVT